ncbi:hypothetical protein FHX41_0805 [Actinomadura hallensis]|uniref:Uncharacterized protein n=1 Tax=Actinomadura hallensis TaxID=337895 RepID=A0A543I9N6_9ACTN|nr:hypothetical protein [Actinomadura hallensis]TQM67200.1 hypothetical protein FHX41_0805 [Actinomadura hallensis]
MSDYRLSDEELASINHTFEGQWHGNYKTPDQVVESPTREEFNNLPEWQQRELFFKYSAGADAGKWDDPKNALPRGTEPERGKWTAKAEEGYEVDPDELRALASSMQYKMQIWKRKLDKVATISVSQADLGNIQGSEEFVGVVNASKAGFQEYIGAIQTAYNGVIERLKATADQYENAHSKTQSTVGGVDPSAGPVPDLS